MELLNLLPFVALVALFWLLVIRPQARRQRETALMQAGLVEGDQVMLTSGVFGTLRGLTEDQVRIEVAEGVVITVARGAVGAVVDAGTGTSGPEEI